MISFVEITRRQPYKFSPKYLANYHKQQRHESDVTSGFEDGAYGRCATKTGPLAVCPIFKTNSRIFYASDRLSQSNLDHSLAGNPPFLCYA